MVADLVVVLPFLAQLFHPSTAYSANWRVLPQNQNSPQPQQQVAQQQQQQFYQETQQMQVQLQQSGQMPIQPQIQYPIQPQNQNQFPQPIQPQQPEQPPHPPSEQSQPTTTPQQTASHGQNNTQKLTSYNEQYAQIMLALSAGAYASSPLGCINRWMPDANLWHLYTATNQTCDILDNPCSSYIIVSEERHEIVVVFRGTKSKEQLFLEGWQSLQPGKDFYGAGKVNKYFFHGLNVLWPSVQQALSDPAHKDFQVTFTGHSLGGALASLASIRTVLEGMRGSNEVKLYTFGQPRVGNAAFAFKHDELVPQSFRVVFRMDIVPHLPACIKNEDYPGVDHKDDSKPCNPAATAGPYHHGTEIWYPYGMDPGDRYYECVGSPRDEDFHCSDSMSFEVSKYRIYISDHRHYFGHKVPAWGKLGCVQNARGIEELMPNGTEEKEQNRTQNSSRGGNPFQKIVQRVKMLGRMFGRGD